MTRAAIYARYSTDKQRETSIEDQSRICRRLADKYRELVENLENVPQRHVARARASLKEITGDVRLTPDESGSGVLVGYRPAARNGSRPANKFGSGGVSWASHPVEFMDVELR